MLWHIREISHALIHKIKIWWFSSFSWSLLICSFILSCFSVCCFIVPRPSQPVLWAGPELFVLSLLSRHSPILPWCWLRTLAANRKSKCHRDVSSGRLLLRPGRQLRRLLPHLAILLIRGVTLQQVGSCPATRGQLGTLTLYRQHSEGSQVSMHAVCESLYLLIWSQLKERIIWVCIAGYWVFVYLFWKCVGCPKTDQFGTVTVITYNWSPVWSCGDWRTGMVIEHKLIQHFRLV